MLDKFRSVTVGGIDNLQLFGFSIVFFFFSPSLFLLVSVSASFCSSVFSSLLLPLSVVIYLPLSILSFHLFFDRKLSMEDWVLLSLASGIIACSV